MDKTRNTEKWLPQYLSFRQTRSHLLLLIHVSNIINYFTETYLRIILKEKLNFLMVRCLHSFSEGVGVVSCAMNCPDDPILVSLLAIRLLRVWRVCKDSSRMKWGQSLQSQKTHWGRKATEFGGWSFFERSKTKIAITRYKQITKVKKEANLFVLFVCLGFFVPLENFSLIWRSHHCRFWPMLGTHGHWAVRGFFSV